MGVSGAPLAQSAGQEVAGTIARTAASGCGPVAHRAQIACGLVLACALSVLPGCSRQDDDAARFADVEPLYEIADYEIAEDAVTGQVRVRLDRQGIQLRGLWLGLRPVADGPPELNADVDAYCRTDQAEAVSRLVAETALRALPKHDTVQVRVYWWSEDPREDWPHPAGAWTWDADGELVSHLQPRELSGTRRSGGR